MVRYRMLASAVVILTLICTSARADEEALPTARTDLDAKMLSERINHHIAARWKEKGVVPAPMADDAEFFRRVSLDLTGRIPAILDLNRFMADRDPDKRAKWTEMLFTMKAKTSQGETQLYVNHFKNFWKQLLFSSASNNLQTQFIPLQMEPWIENHVASNTPYDKMIRELINNEISQPFGSSTNPRVRFQNATFYQAYENKPENIAGVTARLFLGVKLECAQCHDDRSGGSWTQKQFWEYTAFFANLQPRQVPQQGRPAPNPLVAGAPKIKIPEKNETVEARFLDGKQQPEWKSGVTPQYYLADWMTSRENPYFAKAIANRMWYYFMGTGLTDPVDAMSEENPPSHPELLEELAQQLVLHDFDLKYLMRAITGSKPYQLTSARTSSRPDDPRLFARAAVRGMTADQLFDSLCQATGYVDKTPVNALNRGFYAAPTLKGDFINRFTNTTDKPTETETSILQALHMMNGKLLAEMLNPATKDSTMHTLAANKAHPKGEVALIAKNVEELFVVSLSRKPRPDELERFTQYVSSGGPANDRVAALGDVFWALLNSAEFMSNH